MRTLPTSWSEVHFGDLNRFCSRTINPANSPDELFELYSVPSFPSGMPDSQLGNAIGSSKQVVEPADVLVCKINPRINRVWQVMPRQKLRQIASSEWIAMRAHEVDTRFLRHFFSSQEFRELICQDVTGVGGSLTRAQPKRVATLIIPLAPLNEQKRIADKLDAVLARVDACRERLDRVPAILKRFRQSVLAAATSGKLTEDWRAETGSLSKWGQTTVGELLTDLRYGTSKKCSYEPSRTPVLRIPNVINGGVTHEDMKYAEFDEREMRSLSLAAGDILMIRSNGSIGLVGRTALVTDRERGFLYAGYLIRLRFDLQSVMPAYVSIFLTSPERRDIIENVARSTSGVNNINADEIRSLAILVPGINEQTEIIRRVEALFAYADRLEARYAAARAQVERLTPALLAKAFRGELVPQDPNDEPASVLLERISAARASTPPRAKARKLATRRQASKTKVQER